MKIQNFSKWLICESLSNEELLKNDDIKYWLDDITTTAHKKFITLVKTKFESIGFTFIESENFNYATVNAFDSYLFDIICPDKYTKLDMRFSKSGSTMYFSNLKQILPKKNSIPLEKIEKMSVKGHRSIMGVYKTIEKINPLALNPKMGNMSKYGII